MSASPKRRFSPGGRSGHHCRCRQALELRVEERDRSDTRLDRGASRATLAPRETRVDGALRRLGDGYAGPPIDRRTPISGRSTARLQIRDPQLLRLFVEQKGQRVAGTSPAMTPLYLSGSLPRFGAPSDGNVPRQSAKARILDDYDDQRVAQRLFGRTISASVGKCGGAPVARRPVAEGASRAYCCSREARRAISWMSAR